MLAFQKNKKKYCQKKVDEIKSAEWDIDVATFKVLVICGLIYICLIPFGYFSYRKIYKQKILSGENHDNDDLEDIL